MNNLRKAAEAGAELRIYRPCRGTFELRSQKRQAKKALGLSGRQLKKLRKQARRDECAKKGSPR